MNEELLDDDLHSEKVNDVGFILTENATFNLFEAAKWAKISALVIIGFSGFKLIMALYQIYEFKSNSLLHGYDLTYNFISLVEPILTIIVSSFLYSFGDKFLKAYKEDSDDLVDKSLSNLHKYYKFSVIVVAITVSISLLYSLINGELSFIIKYLFFIIPVGLLGFYFYQNRDASNTINEIQDNSTENK